MVGADAADPAVGPVDVDQRVQPRRALVQIAGRTDRVRATVGMDDESQRFAPGHERARVHHVGRLEARADDGRFSFTVKGDE